MAIGSYHLNRFSHFEYGQLLWKEKRRWNLNSCAAIDKE